MEPIPRADILHGEKKRNNNNNPATEVEVLPSNELVLRESESITEPRALVAVLRELLVATSML